MPPGTRLHPAVYGPGSVVDKRCHTSQGPYGIPGGYPAVFVRGIQTGPRWESPSRAVPVRVPTNFGSRDPYGYRTGWAIPPGTRLDPADNPGIPYGPREV